MNRPLQAAGHLMGIAVVVATVLAVTSLLVAPTPPGGDPSRRVVADEPDPAPRPRPGTSDPPLIPRPIPKPSAGGGRSRDVARLAKTLSELHQQLDEFARERAAADAAADAAAGQRSSRLLEQMQDRIQASLETQLKAQLEVQLKEQLGRELRKLDPRPRIEELKQQISLLAEAMRHEPRVPAPPPKIEDPVTAVLEVTASPGRPGRYSIVARDAPLIDVLVRLGELSEREITATADARTPVTMIRLRDVTLEEALEVLLPAAGCAARLEGNRVHVMSMSEARRQRRRLEGPDPAAVASPREVIVDVTIIAARLTDRGPLGLRHLLEEGEPVLLPSTAGGGAEVPLIMTASRRPLDGGVLSGSVPEFLQRLRELTEIRVLATPRLRVVAGHEARLDMGHTLSVAAGKGRRGRVGTMEIGTRLVVRPVLLEDGRIQLDVAPEQQTVLFDLHRRPHHLTASLSTRVLIPDGRTMVLGGLIQQLPETGRRTAAGLLDRLLGRRPATVAAGPGRRELILLVTPRVVPSSPSPEPPRHAERGNDRPHQ